MLCLQLFIASSQKALRLHLNEIYQYASSNTFTGGHLEEVMGIYLEMYIWFLRFLLTGCCPTMLL